MSEVVVTDKAPAAVGTYSAGIKAGKTVFLSGQLGLDPVSGELAESFEAQCRQAFRNVFALVEAAGGKPSNIVRQTVFLTDLANFATVNKVMSEIFTAPYPARSCVQISALPKGGLVEVEATVVLD
ncbi:Rid family detoxifying hydrolase [Parasutterella muris]|jgi:endoribonuclease L-PSP, putative|uniref:RidA family protein n=1 Tax=Parasutterella muris TaxID=2565572 RepID=A0A6L6YEQ4_9BURK|nr:Rid family detoxifying hydrolase [Parasutterella muris]MVX56110.1 RidA family protein [Parasutterella muris]